MRTRVSASARARVCVRACACVFMCVEIGETGNSRYK